MRNHAVFVAIAFSLVACSTVNVLDRTTLFPTEFLAKADRYEVQAPIRRFRPAFYNVQLGRSRVQNTRLGRATRNEFSFPPEDAGAQPAVIWWNSWARNNLDIVNKTGDQFFVNENNEYSFTIAGSEHSVSESDCVIDILSPTNKPVAEPSTLPLGNTDDAIGDGLTDALHAQWVASRLFCTLRHDSQEWVVSKFDHAESVPLIEIKGGGVEYSARVLVNAKTDSRNSLANQAATKPRIVLFEDGVGIGVYRDTDLVAASALLDRKNIIWIDKRISTMDQTLLITMIQSLILNSWLN